MPAEIENNLQSLERKVESQNYRSAASELAYIARNEERFDIDEVERRRMVKAAGELTDHLLQDSREMIEQEENIYSTKAFYSEVEDLVDNIERSDSFLDDQTVKEAERIREKAYQAAVDQKLEKAEDAYERGLEDPANSSAFSVAWDRLDGAESYAEDVDQDYGERIQGLRDEVSENAPEFIYRKMIRDLEAEVFENTDFGVDRTELDTNRLMMANSRIEDIEEMLEYRGDEKLEDLQKFDISEVSREADQVFHNLAELVDEMPFQAGEALEHLQELGEKTGFYHSGVELGIERAEKIQELHNNVNMAESEVEDIYTKLDVREEHEGEEPEEEEVEGRDLVEAFMVPTDVSLEHDVERVDSLLRDVEEKIPEEPDTSKEREYSERSKKLREDLSELKRLI